jgi:hypothetical protein
MLEAGEECYGLRRLEIDSEGGQGATVERERERETFFMVASI